MNDAIYQNDKKIKNYTCINFIRTSNNIFTLQILILCLEKDDH